MTDIEKIDKIFEKTPNKNLLQWMRLKAYTDSKFALSLLDEFWKPDKKDVQSLVESCFMHSYPTRSLKYFWPDVISDLEKMMDRAELDVKKKEFIEAAEISRLVIVMTCRAYQEDFSEYQQYLAPVLPVISRAEDIIRSVLMEGDGIDEDSRRGILSELLEECIVLKGNPVRKFDRLIEEAGVLAWPMKKYLTFVNAKLRRKYDPDRSLHIANKVKCLALHGEKKKIEECLEKELKDEKSRMLYVDYLIEWQEYGKALRIAEERPDTVYFLNWTDKEFEILDKTGDRATAIDYCHRQFMKSHYRFPYYQKLKTLISKGEWSDYLFRLLSHCDFDCDYDHSEPKIYIEEKLTNRFFAYFNRKTYCDIEDLEKYGQYLSEYERPKVVEKYIAYIFGKAPHFERKESITYVASFFNSLLKYRPESKPELQEAAGRFETLVNPRFSTWLRYFRPALHFKI